MDMNGKKYIQSKVGAFGEKEREIVRLDDNSRHPPCFLAEARAVPKPPKIPNPAEMDRKSPAFKP